MENKLHFYLPFRRFLLTGKRDAWICIQGEHVLSAYGTLDVDQLKLSAHWLI